MNGRPAWLDVVDNTFHVVWYTFGMVGAFAIPLTRVIGEHRGVLAAGLVFGLLTSPIARRRLRPRMRRWFPGLTSEGTP